MKLVKRLYGVVPTYKLSQPNSGDKLWSITEEGVSIICDKSKNSKDRIKSHVDE